MSPIVKECVATAGSVQALADALSTTRQAIYQWKKIPADRVRQVEALTGIPDYRLRPDLYRRPQESAA